MKNKINIVVTLESEKSISPAEQIQLVEDFCAIESSSYYLNNVKLTFEIADKPFVVD